MALALALGPERIFTAWHLHPRPKALRIPRLVSHSVSFTPRCQIDLKVKVEKSMYKDELEAAIDVVERACRLCLLVKEGQGQSPNGDGPVPGLRLEKSDASPVTVADLGVQALVSMELGLLFPSIPLVGEEDSSQLREDLSNYQKNTCSTQNQPLVEIVAQAVATVASTRVVNVTTESILNAFDKGVNSISEPETSRIPYWILDPIDGTRGFLRGGDALYVVGLALVVEGEVVLGVMGCPSILYKYDHMSVNGANNLQMASLQQSMEGSLAERCEQVNAIFTGDYQLGLLMAACSGCGCWVKPLSRSPVPVGEDSRQGNFKDVVECKVDRCKSPREALFCISDNEKWRTLPLALALASVPVCEDRLLEHEAQTVPLCCGSLSKYFTIALGGASIFVQHVQDACEVKVWDHAAGVICVVEAGGQVTDMTRTRLQKMLGNGQQVITPQGGGIVASNGHLHEVIIEILSNTQKAPA